MNTKKTVVTDIKIDPDSLAELNRILQSGVSRGVKREAMLRIAGRPCTICGSVPIKLVSYDIGDSEQPASRLEYYCLECYNKSGLVTITATNGIDKTIAVIEKNYTKGAQ